MTFIPKESNNLEGKWEATEVALFNGKTDKDHLIAYYLEIYLEEYLQNDHAGFLEAIQREVKNALLQIRQEDSINDFLAGFYGSIDRFIEKEGVLSRNQVAYILSNGLSLFPDHDSKNFECGTCGNRIEMNECPEKRSIMKGYHDKVLF